ncbi:MAG TPA: hypothetical protein VH186_26380 [Chloroflexia bacterium]|nr:hypothetical protein [Chloroflexia bacterium]
MLSQAKSKKKNLKKTVGSGLVLLTLALGLAACGENASSSTNAPAAAVASASSTTAAGNASGTSSTGANAGSAAQSNSAVPANGNGTGGRQGGFGRGNFGPAITGTIQSYDANSQTLTVTAADGSSQQFAVGQARISKTSTITGDELKQLLTSNTNSQIQFTGQQGSDGSYTATSLTVSDQAALPGRGNGNAGAGPNQGQANGNAGAASNQGQANGNAGMPGQMNGNPPANMPAGGPNGQAGPNGMMILRNATLSGNTLTGTGFNGQSITVNLNSSTTLSKRTAGTATDLKAGSKVSVAAQPAQGSTPANAFAVTVD